MDMKAILERITARRKAIGLSEAALSMQAGSRDLIRNWRRALEAGKEISARHDSFEAVARELGVPLSWLLDGAPDMNGTTSPPPEQPGLQEDARAFSLTAHPVPDGDPKAALRSLWGAAAVTPESFRLSVTMPGFALTAGDVLIVDLARLPAPGDLAIVTIADDNSGTSTTTVFKYLPPWLCSGIPGAKDLRIDGAGITVRHPIIGMLRGIQG